VTAPVRIPGIQVLAPAPGLASLEAGLGLPIAPDVDDLFDAFEDTLSQLPPQRTRLERAGRIVGQLGLALGESAMSTTQGLVKAARLPAKVEELQWLPPVFLAELIGRELDPLLTEGRTAAREVLAPETIGEIGTRIGGRIVGDIAQIAGSGGVSSAVKIPGVVGTVLRGAVRSAPVTALQAGGSREDAITSAAADILTNFGVENRFTEILHDISDDPFKRVAAETALDLAMGIGIESIAPAWRAARGMDPVTGRPRPKPATGEATSRIDELRRKHVERGNVSVDGERRRPLAGLVEAEDRLRAGRNRERLSAADVGSRRGTGEPSAAELMERGADPVRASADAGEDLRRAAMTVADPAERGFLSREMMELVGGAALTTAGGAGGAALADDPVLGGIAGAATTAGVLFGIRNVGLRRALAQAVTERRAAERAARIDELTGLGNQNAFRRAVPAADESPNIGFIEFDIINLKAMNDNVSEIAGDALVARAAAAIREAAEEFGFGERVFRKGGDEIAVIAAKEHLADIQRRAIEIFGRDMVPGTKFQVGLRAGIGDTLEETVEAVKRAKELEIERGLIKYRGGPDDAGLGIPRDRNPDVELPPPAREVPEAPPPVPGEERPVLEFTPEFMRRMQEGPDLHPIMNRIRRLIEQATTGRRNVDEVRDQILRTQEIPSQEQDKLIRELYDSVGERVTSAVVEVDGQIFRGPTHGMAIADAIDKGALDPNRLTSFNPEGVNPDLFETSTGRIIDRFQAYRWFGSTTSEGFNLLDEAGGIAPELMAELAMGGVTAAAVGTASLATGGSREEAATLAAIAGLAGYGPARRALIQRLRNLDESGFVSLMGRESLKEQVRRETSGIGRVAKYLMPEEAAKLRRDTAQKVVNIFDNLPSAGELSSIALAGKVKRGWYRKSAEAISEVFGPDAPRFTALLAALSPQTSVRSNMRNALKTWVNWVDAGRPTDPQAIRRILGMSVEGTKGEKSVLEAWVPNAVRALQSDQPSLTVLSGPKVNSFHRNLLGDVDEVTLDTWMAKVAGITQRQLGGSLLAGRPDPGKGTHYLAYAARVRQTAARLTRMTGETWTPAEVQETVWSWAYALGMLGRAKTGLGESAGALPARRAEGLVGAIDDITDDLLRDVPDFRSLLNEQEFAETLVRGNLATPRRVREAAGRAAGITRQADEVAPDPRDLRRAARRIERAGLDDDTILDEAGFISREALTSLAGGAAGALVAPIVTPGEELDPIAALAGFALGAGGGVAAGRRAAGRALEEVPEGVTREAPGRIPSAQRQASLGVAAPVPGRVQFNKFGLDQIGQTKLEERIAGFGSIRRRVTHEEVATAARRLGMSDIRAADLNDQVDGVTLLAIRQQYQDNQTLMSSLQKQLDELTATSPEGRSRVVQALAPDQRRLREWRVASEIARLDNEQEALLRIFIPRASDAGRTLNSLRILAQMNLQDPMPWVAKATRLAGRDLLPEERHLIEGLVSRGDRAGLIKAVRDMAAPTKTLSLEGLNLIRRAMLLTGFRTQSRNLLSNTAEAVMREMDNPTAAGADKLLSFMVARMSAGRVTGIRTRTLTSLGERVSASRRGAMVGMENFGKVMRGIEVDEATLRRLDLRREAALDNKFFDTIVKFMFRLQGGADQPFRQVAVMGSLVEQAKLLGKRQGLSGADLEKFIDDFLNKPPDDAVLQAGLDGMEAVFQNRSTLGNLIGGAKARLATAARQKGRKGFYGRMGAAALDFVIPFGQTPSAIIGRLLERTPVGLVSTIPSIFELARLARSGASPADIAKVQREISTAVGRGATGSAAMLLGYGLAGSGLMSGRWPESQTEQRAWLQEGKTEDSILIDGRWLRLSGISPLGNIMALGAQLYYDIENPPEPMADNISAVGNITTNLVLGAARTVKEQSFLRGVNDLLDAIDNDRGMADRFFLSSVGSFVPIQFGDWARFVDPVARRPETFVEAIIARVPFASMSVPAVIDEFGRPRVDEGGIARWTRLADPFLSRRRRDLDDPVLAELNRVGATVSKPDKLAGEDTAMYRQRRAFEGRNEMEAILVAKDHPSYRQLGIEDQREVLKDVITSVRRTLRSGGAVPQSWNLSVSNAINNVRRARARAGR